MKGLDVPRGEPAYLGDCALNESFTFVSDRPILPAQDVEPVGAGLSILELKSAAKAVNHQRAAPFQRRLEFLFTEAREDTVRSVDGLIRAPSTPGDPTHEAFVQQVRATVYDRAAKAVDDALQSYERTGPMVLRSQLLGVLRTRVGSYVRMDLGAIGRNKAFGVLGPDMRRRVTDGLEEGLLDLITQYEDGLTPHHAADFLGRHKVAFGAVGLFASAVGSTVAVMKLIHG